jgi:hypothetical protein
LSDIFVLRDQWPSWLHRLAVLALPVLLSLVLLIGNRRQRTGTNRHRGEA